MKINKSRNGFYVGAAIGFLGYLIQATSGANPNELDISELLLDCFIFSILSGCLIFLGVSSLAGRGHADNINSQKRDNEIRERLNQEVATHNISDKK